MSISGHSETASQVGQARPDHGFLRFLRRAALIALVAGAGGSAGLTLYAGHRTGAPRLLLGLFAVWVLSPFAALVVGYMISKRWSAPTRATLDSAMLIVTVASLTVYGVVALGPARPRTAVFVAFPLASWLLVLIVVSIAAFMSRRSSR